MTRLPPYSTSRRQFLSLAAGAALAGSPGMPANAAVAHRFIHGDFDISVLSDGFLTLSADILLPDAAPEVRLPILTSLGGDITGARVQANIPLIRYGDDLILIDNGAGGNFQPSTGRLEGNLRSAGVDPSSITKVVFTHAHPDHSGATTTSDGKVLYPNARYYIGRNEWDFWTDKNFETRRPKALHGFAKGAQRDLFAVEGRTTLLRNGDEIVPGMSVIDTPGHTPGHISLELAGRDNLLITGDACTNDVIFFEHPDWHFGFDTDGELALRNRRALLDRAASEKLKLLGYHWTYPGVGYADRAGGAYRFVAA
ncbi:MBL fold metallo-hydrolase [Rhizobium glycinendophyticum]|uniref:MBL fold metallo-hydrolase n=1 Tax=Rhizobium glycinendophyticum TaxID=2589807 RepID=A0A504TUJ1_9HYPH|nr:MBL fold metallo-hydrolase [Rhizobium glycinendophyticum]TPP06084.1 MBL fold metallo-hydrolase [Rhizobium glycinendophyticum]